MLSSKCVTEYRKQFPNDSCFFSEPGPGIFIFNKDNNKSYISPFKETTESFFDRLERSKNSKRNLFYEEWDEYKPNDNVVY